MNIINNNKNIILLVILGIVILYKLKDACLIKEGLDNNNSTSIIDKPKAIKDKSYNLEDKLLISKYKTSYEDIIIELEKNIELHIIKSIIDNSVSLSEDATSKSNINLIDNINKLNLFLENLNKNILLLDKH